MNEFKAGFVGLIGHPNAGKSSFLNRMVAEKVAAVTPKPQTTRRRVLGIVTEPGSQVVFVDAPGLVKTSTGINPFLQKELQSVIEESDVLLAIVSLDTETPEMVDEILDMVANQRKPWCVFINKTDLQEKAHRLGKIVEKIEARQGRYFTGTCSHDEGVPVADILAFCREKLPPNPGPLYDSEIYTPHTIRELAVELVREKCFEFLEKELPYQMAVRIIKFDESDLVPRLSFEVLVSKETHKGIVIGKAGATLKKIGIESRKDIEKLMGKQVFLQFHVAIRPQWMTNTQMMEELGYVVSTK
jgi:GTP-binding protein Era